MPDPVVTIAIPTLAAGAALADCLQSLVLQSERNFEIIVIDNSGKGLARESGAGRFGARILEQTRNIGFGAAINLAFWQSRAPYLATLNDDAVACPGWIAALLAAADSHPRTGMFASQVRLAGGHDLDSTGMLVSGDGTSKQRGHGQAPETFDAGPEALFPSGSAALYRRAMLEEIGLFDEDFFLYCEDTDLGLRARWAGWECLYVPEAIAEHDYSRTAGRASPLKAYYVERNRLYVLAKNFPPRLLLRAPASSLARYYWHMISAFEKRSAAAQFRERHGLLELAFIVARAHAVALFHLRRLLAERRHIRRGAKLTGVEFERLLERHWITPREVAAQ